MQATARTGPAQLGPAIALPALPEGEGALMFVNVASGVDPLRPEPRGFISRELPHARIHVLGEGERITELVSDALNGADPPRAICVLDVRVLHARGGMPRLRGLVALAFGVRASRSGDLGKSR